METTCKDYEPPVQSAAIASYAISIAGHHFM
jgi:hypothetical protein